MSDEVTRLEEAIAALEQQRGLLGDDVVDTAVRNLMPHLEKAVATEVGTEQQRKQVTVLFADVTGFTRMSETMDAEDVAERMNAIWARLDQIIVDGGGRVDKHIGDAVMGLWGAPVAREDDPQRAVAAALAMQSALSEFSSTGSESPLMMRIGINTGPVLLGTVGSTAEYTAIGHTVNLASRLESAAPSGGVLISHDTYTFVREIFNVGVRDPLQVKGVAEPVRTYVVVELKARKLRMGTRDVAGVVTEFIGREKELEALTSALPPEPIGESSVRLLTTMGDAGVGKSRLLFEFLNWLDSRDHGTYLFRGRATAADEIDAYALLRDILSFRFEIADSDSPAQAKAKLDHGLAAVGGEAAQQWAPFIGQVIGLDYSETPAIAELLDDPRLILERAERHLREFLAKGVAGRYCVMLIEDIHWADVESLDLLERLATDVVAFPFLIVANTRPSLVDRRRGWLEEDDPWRRVVRLQPLDASGADALVDSIFSRMSEVPSQLRETILERSEGNPFYIESLVKMLVDDGVIITGEEWSIDASRLADLRIPPTLTGVVQARVDALPRDQKKALQEASVIGRVFWQDALVSLLTADMRPVPGPDDVSSWMDAGRRRELVYAQQTSAFADTVEYMFKHAIIHEVVYESVTRKLRAVYHGRVAAWLVARAGERAGEFASRIADHYERAGRVEETARWLVVSADQAKRSYAPESAMRDYQRALELWGSLPDGPPDRAVYMDALEGLGEAMNTRGRYDEARERFEDFARVAEAAGDDAASARSLHGLSVALAYKGEFRQGLEAAERGAAAGRARGDELLTIRCGWMQAWCLMRLGELAGAEEVATSVIDRSRVLGNEAQLAKAQNLAGVLQYARGNYPAAASFFEEAVGTFRAMSSPESVMPILNNLGVLDEARGDFAGAVKHYSAALAIADEIGSRQGEIAYSSNLGMAKLGLGLFDEAEADFRSVINLASAGVDVLSETYRGLAEALTARGRFAEAGAAALESLRLAIESEARDLEAGAWRLLGLVSGSLGSSVELHAAGLPGEVDADGCFERSVTLAEADEDDAEVARALATWAGWSGEDGGGEMHARAERLFADLGVKGELERWESAGRSARGARS